MHEQNKQGRMGSRIFLVLGTKVFFEDPGPEAKQQYLLAKGLGKPFRVLVDIDAVVPDWFRVGVADYKEVRIDIKKFCKGKLKDFDFKAFIEQPAEGA